MPSPRSPRRQEMKLSPRQREALELVADGKFVPCLVKENDGWHARWRALGGGEANGWVDEYIREATITRLSEDAEDQRHETLHDAWLLALRSRTGLVVWDDAECAAFAAELEAWGGNAEEDRVARACIRFRLAAVEASERFELLCETPCDRRGLKALGQAAYVWPALVGLRTRSPRLLGMTLTPAEAEDFVRTGARHLRDAGYGVEGADLAASITAVAEVSGEAGSEGSGDEGTRFGPGGIRLTVRVGGEPVSAAEIRFLLDQGSTLVHFRDRWIEVDRNILREALRALEKGVGPRAHALSFALGLGHVGRLEIEEARAHGWLRGLVNELCGLKGLTGLSGLSGLKGMEEFRGELRDYQLRGVEWLRFLTRHGFGALLADDMGLGKTIQVIAWLIAERGERGEWTPMLIVAPLTVLSNWRHELARFAPGLRVYVHQGDSRHFASGFRKAVAEADVTLTSYNLLVKDYDGFSGVRWHALVLDEAQAVKNPDTQVARAVCALTPPRRIALTGTPVENSVADIWSLEEFLNPGFLGERRAFTDRFVRPIAADAGAAAARRLQHALEPFILRRLKTDPRIAAELGEKREIREYCELSPEQRRDYETALATFRAREREPGDVFALLTELKLICDGAGKLERLLDLLEAIFAADESALVFSQYAKVGARLRTAIEQRFKIRCPFLHGGLSAREREEAIAQFNRRGPRAFVLSLKAGGFGLNLTKATHVIHFDRWWNPAVESQATDRAHRIGQNRTVFVHLLISAGTLEEHVDEILARKARIAGQVVMTGESFLLSLGEKELLETVRLDGAEQQGGETAR